MSINDALLPEFDREMAHTAQVLDRLPAERLDWRPHEKSRTAGELASHIAGLPRWVLAVFDTTVFDLESVGWRTAAAAGKPEIVELFRRHSAAARQALAVRTDAEYLARWTLRREGEVVFTMPKAAVIRTMVINHLIHHRGQLTVYLRMLGATLTPLYGPTADDV
jgi:uncharacterized damage-inducible protein DinB